MKYEQPNNSDEELQRYKRLFHNDWASMDDVRDKANEEYRFLVVAGGQWEGWLEDSHENRAKLEMNHLSEYVRRNHSQYTTNRPSVNYSPLDNETSEDTAKVLDGAYRRDILRSGGMSAQDTAVWEAMCCGFGAEILNTEWEDEGDPDNEHQNIVATEQPNAYSTVVFDSSARRADKADAKHCTVLTPYSRHTFEEMWPDVTPSSMMVDDRSHFNWSLDDLVYAATFYERDIQRIELHTYTHPDSGEIVRIEHNKTDDDEAAELELLGFTKIRERVIKRKSVYKTLYCGSEILEKRKRIVGEYIPVIPYFGFRGYVDGMEYFHGLARERMDTQRVLNTSFSLAAETAATGTDKKPIFYADQMISPSVAASWATNDGAYRVIDPILGNDGNPIHNGMIGFDAGGEMPQALLSLIDMSSQSLQVGTGGAPQDIADPNASGKAIQALIKRIDQNTEIIFDGINKSVKHKGRVYASMAKEVYGNVSNTGRTIRAVQDSGEVKPITLRSAGVVNGQVAPINDLSKGKFDVSVDVSADYHTQREETFEELKDIIALIPPEDPLRPIMIRQLILLKDISGLDSAKDRIRKDMMMQGYIVPESDEDKAFMQQMMQAQGQQQPDPNAMLLQAAAAEQETQANLNQASIADKMATAAKKAVEIEETKVDIALKKQELVGGSIAQQG